jgi:hypothetical protein
MASEINWLRIERLIRQELRTIVSDTSEQSADVSGVMARSALHRIDLILGDETGRGYEIEGKAPVYWLDIMENDI